MTMKLKLLNWLGWLILVIGVVLYIFPIFHEQIGSYSGLVAFVVIFVGISLLKYRKDQLNK
jgi:hypothetical protein